VLDQAERGNLKRPYGIHQQQFTGCQLDAPAVLGNAAVAAALTDQEAILVIIMICVGRVTLDATGVGPQIREGKASPMDIRHLTNEQRAIEGQLGIEVAASRPQIPVPGVQPVLPNLLHAHGVLRSGFFVFVRQ
jgi:hypothetical protein